MELQKLSLQRYKGYAEPTEIKFAPLTILVGANNSGKTALIQAIQLFAGGLVPAEKSAMEPLPLTSGGIQHGETFEDLVTGRTVHGSLSLSASFANKTTEFLLSATVRNVVAPPLPSERQISEWSLVSNGHKLEVTRQGFEKEALYNVCISGSAARPERIGWQGLIPDPPSLLPDWLRKRAKDLKGWALGVRHLRCPRSIPTSPFSRSDRPSLVLGPTGRNTPLVLATDDELRESVRKWYRKAFGVSIDVVAQGSYSELVTRASSHDTNVRLVQAGRGLSHVLPVVVTALTARKAGAGVDIVEHPEAELHPAAHTDIADLLLENLVGPTRPIVVETHSAMILLRTRRWIAEGRLPPDSVLIYWIQTEPGRGSILRKITINDSGDLESWPEGVFIEDYEETIAIRRARRLQE